MVHLGNYIYRNYSAHTYFEKQGFSGVVLAEVVVLVDDPVRFGALSASGAVLEVNLEGLPNPVIGWRGGGGVALLGSGTPSPTWWPPRLSSANAPIGLLLCFYHDLPLPCPSLAPLADACAAAALGSPGPLADDSVLLLH
jgi:hypothetical protein